MSPTLVATEVSKSPPVLFTGDGGGGTDSARGVSGLSHASFWLPPFLSLLARSCDPSLSPAVFSRSPVAFGSRTARSGPAGRGGHSWLLPLLPAFSEGPIPFRTHTHPQKPLGKRKKSGATTSPLPEDLRGSIDHNRGDGSPFFPSTGRTDDFGSSPRICRPIPASSLGSPSFSSPCRDLTRPHRLLNTSDNRSFPPPAPHLARWVK